jgi:hypothetical protein
MGAPAWLTGSFTALMLTVATYCAGRLAVTRRWQRPTEFDTDAGHVLMGVAMAGLLVARLRILPAATWEAVFAAGTAGFAWQLVKSRRRTAAASWQCLHPAPHLVECVAMLYMFFAATPLTARSAAVGMAGLAPSRFSVLALLMALFMVGYVVRVADRIPLRTPAPPPPPRPGPPPPPPPSHPPGDLRTTENPRTSRPRLRDCPPLPSPPLRRPMQDRHGPHHGLHAGPDALASARSHRA